MDEGEEDEEEEKEEEVYFKFLASFCYIYITPKLSTLRNGDLGTVLCVMATLVQC